MQESLGRLRDPELDLCNVLCQLILDIRQILNCHGMPVHARLAAIAEAVDELAPPPPPGG